ncbi:MAG: hypothetical protein NW237_13500, partial [Cyanobacteriota bacterium]|nr:hypothetical protein [Cyanobacteriota bacterium]
DGGIAEMIGCYHFLSEVKGITAHAVGKLNLSNLNSFMFYVNNEKAVSFILNFWKAYQKIIPKNQHEAVGKETGATLSDCSRSLA